MANTSKDNTGKIAVGAAAAGLVVGTALGAFAKSDKAKKMKAEAEAKLAETKEKAKEKGEELKQKAEKVQKELKKDMKEAKKDAKNKMDA
jgi:Flp pilus assembly protein TadB